jgi:hypothetical protein
MWDDRDMAKRPRDPNQLAKSIVNIATGEAPDEISGKKKTASIKGRRGGLKGGASRAQNLTPEQRQDIARVAARARWKKSD